MALILSSLASAWGPMPAAADDNSSSVSIQYATSLWHDNLLSSLAVACELMLGAPCKHGSAACMQQVPWHDIMLTLWPALVAEARSSQRMVGAKQAMFGM
jgi:hypothetical protein